MGTDLNAYNGISYQMVVVTVHAGAMFIHGRARTVNLYQQDVEAYGTAYAEADLSFWTQETPPLSPAGRHHRCLQSLQRTTRLLSSEAGFCDQKKISQWRLDWLI